VELKYSDDLAEQRRVDVLEDGAERLDGQPSEAKAPSGKHGTSAIPLTRRLAILGHITEETDDAEQQRLMQAVPAPARLAYKLIGHRQFTRETTAIRG
jgi:hypothetical protein